MDRYMWVCEKCGEGIPTSKDDVALHIVAADFGPPTKIISKALCEKCGGGFLVLTKLEHR